MHRKKLQFAKRFHGKRLTFLIVKSQKEQDICSANHGTAQC